MLSDSEYDDLHSGGSPQKKTQKKEILEKDLKEKETLLAIGCYNLAVQHEHQHNWPECFSFYEKAIEKCEESLGSSSKLLADFKEAYDRARKHHSSRSTGSPSKDVASTLSGVKYRGHDRYSDNIEELRKSAIRQITPKSNKTGKLASDTDQEYWNYGSPERKKKIMLHYLNAVRMPTPTSPMKKSIKGTMDNKHSSPPTRMKQRMGHFS